MGTRTVHVKTHMRKTKNGKIRVKSHKRKVKSKRSDDLLAQIPRGDYYKENLRRLADSSPDMREIAKETYRNPNKLHQKFPEEIDVYKFDTKDAPTVSKLPEYGKKGQLVKLKGKYYVADENGKWKIDTSIK